jgi:HK97 family phage prohead protease
MYKNIKSSIKDLDQKGRVVVTANAFNNVDSQMDMSMKGSFSKTLNEHFKRVKWYLNHDTTKLIGVPIEGKETDTHLELVGQLNLNKEIGKDVYEDYKLYAEYGRTLEHSIGVDAIKYNIEGQVRKVSEWKLWEYSTLTNWGANPDTGLVAIKSDIDWMNIQLNKGDYTDEKFLEIEKHLKLLKSLIAEPQSTQPEPIDLKAISAAFINSLK